MRTGTVKHLSISGFLDSSPFQGIWRFCLRREKAGETISTLRKFELSKNKELGGEGGGMREEEGGMKS